MGADAAACVVQDSWNPADGARIARDRHEYENPSCGSSHNYLRSSLRGEEAAAYRTRLQKANGTKQVQKRARLCDPKA